MFKYAESVPSIYPARTAVTQSTVGPVVWCESVVGNTGTMVAFNGVEFWELVRAGLPLLNDKQRSELIGLFGGADIVERAALVERAENAEAAIEAARSDLDGFAAQIAAQVVQVIDLDTERAKRRPTPTAA
jgi:hypothetical protein